MKQHVLLFHMSIYRSRLENGRYKLPQTNEAALQELIRLKDRPDKIVALCSTSVRTASTVSVEGQSFITTLTYFQQTVLKRFGIPAENFVSVPVPDSMTDAAQAAAIESLLSIIQPEDSLSIDLSGGPRDTAMLLVTAARCLRDLRNVETNRVIYSELSANDSSKIHDSTQLYNLFDFVTAMDEFFSTGTARKLRTYLYGEYELTSPLHGLLSAVNQFSDDLSLCRAQALQSDLSAISSALKNVTPKSSSLNDLLFRLLTDRIKSEFSSLLTDSKNNLPSLVHWCADHGMYQQALTLLCEQMPAYVCRHLFLQPTQTGWNHLESREQNKGKSWVHPLFHFHFCRLNTMSSPHFRDSRIPDLYLGKGADDSSIFRTASEAEISIYLQFMEENGNLVFDPAQEFKIASLIRSYQYVITYRNRINHASDQYPSVLQGSSEFSFSVEKIKDFLSHTESLLESIRHLKPAVPDGMTLLSIDKKILSR